MNYHSLSLCISFIPTHNSDAATSDKTQLVPYSITSPKSRSIVLWHSSVYLDRCILDPHISYLARKVKRNWGQPLLSSNVHELMV